MKEKLCVNIHNTICFQMRRRRKKKRKTTASVLCVLVHGRTQSTFLRNNIWKL